MASPPSFLPAITELVLEEDATMKQRLACCVPATIPAGACTAGLGPGHRPFARRLMATQRLLVATFAGDSARAVAALVCSWRPGSDSAAVDRFFAALRENGLWL